MPGLIVMTLVVPFADADEIERRTDVKQLTEPEKWASRTEAILDELQLARTVRLAPHAQTGDDAAPPFEISAAISEAEVVAGGPSRARRRAVHDLYIDLLRQDLEETVEDDPEAEDEDQDLEED